MGFFFLFFAPVFFFTIDLGRASDFLDGTIYVPTVMSFQRLLT